MLDEPNGRFGRWGQVASALATFAILGSVILFVVLYWLLEAPLWFICIVAVPIAIFSTVFGFTVVDDEELESDSVTEAGRDSDDSGFRLMEPKNRFGRFGQVVVTVWSICAVMGVVHAMSSEVFGLGFRDWDPWAQGTVFLAVCMMAFFFEMTTLGEDDEEDRLGPPVSAPTRDGANARYHQSTRS